MSHQRARWSEVADLGPLFCQVLGRVARVTPRLAALDLAVVDGQPLGAGAGAGPLGSGALLGGVLRKENVVAKEVDRVDMYEAFRCVRAHEAGSAWIARIYICSVAVLDAPSHRNQS